VHLAAQGQKRGSKGGRRLRKTKREWGKFSGGKKKGAKSLARRGVEAPGKMGLVAPF